MTLLNLLPGRTALLSGALLLNCALGVSAKKVDFAREVLPILSNKCFVCHGPDTRKKDELRLDSFEAATSDRGGYRAIDPEDPGESEMLVRRAHPLCREHQYRRDVSLGGNTSSFQSRGQ